MLTAILTVVLLLSPPSRQAPGDDAFRQLRTAYATRDAAAAARAYVDSAEVVYRYAGAPEERHRGRAAITASFAALFAQIDSTQRLDLNFRVTSRRGRRVEGLYRLRIGAAQTLYGRFDVLLDGSGRFLRDTSTDATAAEFDAVRAPIMFAAPRQRRTLTPPA